MSGGGTPGGLPLISRFSTLTPTPLPGGDGLRSGISPISQWGTLILVNLGFVIGNQVTREITPKYIPCHPFTQYPKGTMLPITNGQVLALSFPFWNYLPGTS